MGSSCRKSTYAFGDKMNNGYHIEQFMLLDRWDMPLAVIDKTVIAEGKTEYETFATVQALEDKYGTGNNYQTVSVLEVLKQSVDAKAKLIINGILDTPVEFYYEDIMQLEPELDIIVQLVSSIKKKITKEELLEKVEEETIIFLGQFPKMEQGETFGVHTVKHTTENYEMIPVFLNENNAKKYNTAQHPMTKTTLKELRNFYNKFGIIIEPQKKYWVMIEPKE